MIPTIPLRARNRLASAILAALDDAEARRAVAALASGAAPVEPWLAPDAAGHGEAVRRRARAAAAAVSTLPVGGGGDVGTALDRAAALFDAGLGFEVHEVLEPYWAAAGGAEREALQGLIQVAVGYQHLANGNAAGAQALLAEGTARLEAGALPGLDLGAFARAVRASLAALPGRTPLPRFPRRAPAA